MLSYSEYYRQRLKNQKIRLQELETNSKIISLNIIGKKRTYEEAMGYPNDYLVVQEPESIETLGLQNKGYNCIDAYLENLYNEKNKK